jgi:plasmid stabilization system protein ParE
MGRNALWREDSERNHWPRPQFIEVSLEAHPRAGKLLPRPNLYESWIPKTPFVVFYRVDDDADTVWMLALFHAAQDRSDFDPAS